MMARPAATLVVLVLAYSCSASSWVYRQCWTFVSRSTSSSSISLAPSQSASGTASGSLALAVPLAAAETGCAAGRLRVGVTIP